MKQTNKALYLIIWGMLIDFYSFCHWFSEPGFSRRNVLKWSCFLKWKVAAMFPLPIHHLLTLHVPSLWFSVFLWTYRQRVKVTLQPCPCRVGDQLFPLLVCRYACGEESGVLGLGPVELAEFHQEKSVKWQMLYSGLWPAGCIHTSAFPLRDSETLSLLTQRTALCP